MEIRCLVWHKPRRNYYLTRSVRAGQVAGAGWLVVVTAVQQQLTTKLRGDRKVEGRGEESDKNFSEKVNDLRLGAIRVGPATMLHD